MTYDNLPSELRLRNQWVTWAYEDHGGVKPTKVPYNVKTGQRASVTDPFSWADYDTAVSAVRNGLYSGIGFVLTKADPYTFIDLDDTHEDSDAMARQKRIYEAFDTYSEVSPSGKGLHLIVKGNVPSGRKRSYVEVYSDVRFMTCTGNVYRDAPIQERHELANSLWAEMGGQAVMSTYEGDAVQKEDDSTVINKAAHADNGEKFQALWLGNWTHYYSSQSEADFALINIIAFYTQHKQQIVRLFRMSSLGQRAKANRDVYVDYMVSRSFDRMLPPIDIDGLKIHIEEQLAARRAAAPANPFEAAPAPQQVYGEAPAYQPPPVVNAPHIAIEETDNFVYVKPPGIVGDIANFLYDAAPRQVPEIALVGALALMSGICGRAYNISGVGLNQYIFLLAATGSGKDGIATGIDKLMAALKLTVPSASTFIGPSEIASPEALLKYLDSTSNCFVSLISEFALKLKQLTSLGASPAQEGLKRLVLALFSMSGAGKQVQPLIYSDKQKNTAAIEAPSFSIMGESTPEGFYASLDEGMISDGLLPRFTIIEYNGKRPPLNEDHHKVKPSPRLIENLSGLCGQALTLNQANRVVDVKCDDVATAMFRDFEVHTTNLINQGAKDAVKQLWNRAHLKALKLSALVSVGNNPFNPVVDEATATWAIELVVHDTTKLLKRFAEGKYGELETEDTRQIHDMAGAIKDYLTKSVDELKRYQVDYSMHNAKIVNYSYLSKRLLNQTSYRNDRLGATATLKKCLQVLIDRGDLQELGPQDRGSRFKTAARCFAVANLKNFLDA